MTYIPSGDIQALSDEMLDADKAMAVKSLVHFRQSPDDRYNAVGVQNPLPTDGDALYGKDIWIDESDMGDFSGSVLDLVDNIQSVVTNTTATNPKVINIRFNRTLVSNTIGLGAYSGNFSNVKIEIENSGGVYTTVVDESTVATKYTSRTYQLPVTAGFNGIRLTFATADTVTLSNLVMLKTNGVVARIQGVDVDNIVRDVGVQFNGSLNTNLVDGQTGKRAEIEPLGALKTIIPVRLVGTTFANGTKDTNFWTETVTGTGSVTQAGEIILATGTTADSTARYQTVKKSRKITGTTNQFKAVARNVQAPAADCIRRIGAYDGTSGVDGDGFFLQFDGETFGVGSRKNGTDTVVENGSFNGNAGATIDFGSGTDFTRLVIDYTALSAKFFINDVLIHTISATTSSLTNSLNLPTTMEIINENGEDTNNSYEILFATILRLGKLETNSKYYHISGNAATYVLKYNAGTLQKIMFNNTSGTNLTIYDNTSAAGDIIGIITTTSNCIGEWEYNVPFNNGLTIVTTGNSLDATVIYE